MLRKVWSGGWQPRPFEGESSPPAVLRAKGRTLPLVEQQHPGPAGRVFSNKTKTTTNLNQSSPVYIVLYGLLFVVIYMSEVVARSY